MKTFPDLFCNSSNRENRYCSKCPSNQHIQQSVKRRGTRACCLLRSKKPVISAMRLEQTKCTLSKWAGQNSFPLFASSPMTVVGQNRRTFREIGPPQERVVVGWRLFLLSERILPRQNVSWCLTGYSLGKLCIVDFFRYLKTTKRFGLWTNFLILTWTKKSLLRWVVKIIFLFSTLANTSSWHAKRFSHKRENSLKRNGYWG